MHKKLFVLLLLFTYSVLSAQSFVVKTIHGKTLHIDATDETFRVREYPNKILFIDFFSSTCNPCIEEFPTLIKLQNTFQKSVQIIGFESASPKDDKQLAKFAEKHNLNYPIINLNQSTKLINFAMKNTDWIGALPYKLVYDNEGVFSHKLYGSMTWKILIKVLEDL